jgi:hypothetical protein
MDRLIDHITTAAIYLDGWASTKNHKIAAELLLTCPIEAMSYS